MHAAGACRPLPLRSQAQFNAALLWLCSTTLPGSQKVPCLYGLQSSLLPAAKRFRAAFPVMCWDASLWVSACAAVSSPGYTALDAW